MSRPANRPLLIRAVSIAQYSERGDCLLTWNLTELTMLMLATVLNRLASVGLDSSLPVTFRLGGGSLPVG
jgi:hypothetical protein